MAKTKNSSRASLLRLFVLLVVALIPGVARAIPPVITEGRSTEIVLGTRAEYLEDKSTALSFAQIRSAAVAAQFRPTTEDTPSFGLSSSAYWFHFAASNPSAAHVELLLEVGYPLLDEIQVFIERDDGTFGKTVAGDRLPFDAREIKHPNFLFPLDLSAGAERQIYVRVATTSVMQVPLSIVSRDRLASADLKRQLGTGLAYGFMLMLVVYNLFLFLSVRDTSYLYYVTYIFVGFWFQACMNGAVYQWLLGSSPWWHEKSVSLCLSLMLLSVGSFSRRFLDLERLPGMSWAVRATMVFTSVGGACTALSLFVPYPWILRVVILIAVPGCFVMIWVGFRAWQQGVHAARFYLVAWTAFFVGFFITTMSKMGAFPRTALTENAMQVGHMVEAVLLSFALADRINVMKVEKELAQANTLAIQKEANLNLQREVDDQTRVLQEQATKLQVLDKQKTHFFQSISHELRTPLTLILNPLEEVVREETANDERLQIALRNARRLLRLVNQLLDFQKLAAHKKEWRLTSIELGPFLRSCGEYFVPTCRAEGIDFDIQVPDEPVFVRAEADALEKIVFNYLANALKYTPRGKRIVLSLDEGEHGQVRIVVVDQGPGIATGARDRLFQLFSQVDTATNSTIQEGTGLGLALVKELTEAMGGEVGVSSELGVGSRFWASFPRLELVESKREIVLPTGRQLGGLALSRHLPAASMVPLASAPADAPIVLVVDDIADMRDIVARTLSRHSYQVRTAASGMDALVQARVAKPDLIVTDWMMPEMSGPELVAAVRSDPALSSVPVVLLTAKSDEESRVAGAEVGADAFLGKPFNELELVSTVRNLIRLKEREKEAERLNRYIAENVLKRYLPPTLVDDVLAGKATFDAKPDSYQATLLFADIAGFTRTSAQLRANGTARLVNEYLSAMTDVIFAHEGTIDKFMGDGIMVIFGAPVRLDGKEQAARAAACALAMQRAFLGLRDAWMRQGIPELNLRIGLHLGPVIVGSFGGERRSDYTAIGPTVNLASRIEHVCTPGEVFATGEVCDYLPEGMAVEAGSFDLKGIEGKIRCFRLVHPAAPKHAPAGASLAS